LSLASLGASLLAAPLVVVLLAVVEDVAASSAASRVSSDDLPAEAPLSIFLEFDEDSEKRSKNLKSEWKQIEMVHLYFT